MSDLMQYSLLLCLLIKPIKELADTNPEQEKLSGQEKYVESTPEGSESRLLSGILPVAGSMTDRQPSRGQEGKAYLCFHPSQQLTQPQVGR